MKKIIYIGIIIVLSSCIKVVEKDEAVVKQEYLDSLNIIISNFENEKKAEIENEKKYAVAAIKCTYCTYSTGSEGCISWATKVFRSDIEEIPVKYTEEEKYKIIEKLASHVRFCEDERMECQIEKNFYVFDKYSQASEFRIGLIKQ